MLLSRVAYLLILHRERERDQSNFSFSWSSTSCGSFLPFYLRDRRNHSVGGIGLVDARASGVLSLLLVERSVRTAISWLLCRRADEEPACLVPHSIWSRHDNPSLLIQRSPTGRIAWRDCE